MNGLNLTHKVVLCAYALFLSFNSAFAKCEYKQSLGLKELPIGIMLTWSTEYEKNNRWFSIERSLDGQTFNEIGLVEAEGNSNELNEYHFLDVQPEGKRLFFRLKQVDFDGSYHFSDVIIYDNANSTEVRITRISDSNMGNQFEIELYSSINKQIKYMIKDSQGTFIREESTDLIIGSNILSIDLEGKELGVYQVFLNLGKESDLLTLKKD